MALKHWPPFGSNKAEKEDGLEYVPTARPAALAEGLIDMAPEHVEEYVQKYVNAMNEYAADHNIYIAEEKVALNKAGERLIAASKAAAVMPGVSIDGSVDEQRRLQSELQTAFNELNGPLSDALEEKIKANNQRLDKIRNETPKEREQSLEQGVSNIQELKTERNSSTEGQGERRSIERETKAQKFAEEHGITGAREAMLAAENEYKAAYQALHEKTWTLGRKVDPEIREKYNQAQLAWRQALATAVENGSEREKVMARFIGIRDTALRGETARQEAMRAALDEKGKKVHSKLIGWGKTGAIKLAQGLSWVTNKAGSGLASVHETLFVKEGEEFNKEKVAQNYARAVRVLGSAVVATALTGGYGMAFPLLLRITRGTVGTFGGAYFGAKLGEGYDELVNTGRQEALLASLKDKAAVGADSLEALQEEAKLYAKGNARAREAGRKRVEILSAALFAGGTSIGTSFAMGHNPFASLSSVQKSAENIQNAQGTSGTGIATGLKVPGATPTPNPLETGAHIGGNTIPSGAPLNMDVGATIHHAGEGTGALFEDLKSAIRSSGLYQPGSESPALKHFLNTNVNELSRGVGAEAFDGNGLRTHMGDQFFVDDHQNIWYQPMNGKPQVFIENDGSSTGFKIHKLSIDQHATVVPKPEATKAPLSTESINTSEPPAPQTPSESTSTNIPPAPEPISPPMGVPMDNTPPLNSVPSETIPTPEPPAAPSPETLQPQAPAPSPFEAPKPSVPDIQPESVGTPNINSAPAAPETINGPSVSPTDLPPSTVPAPTPEALPTLTVPTTEAPIPAPAIPSAESITSLTATPLNGPINVNEMHLYQVKVGESPVLWGGTMEMRHNRAMSLLNDPASYLNNPESKVKGIWVENDTIDPKTGKHTMYFWTKTPQGEILGMQTTEKRGGFLGLFAKTYPKTFDPKKFTGIIR